MNITTKPIELNVTVKIPVVYRTLGRNEIVQRGDEYAGIGGWTPSGNIGLSAASSGLNYRRPMSSDLSLDTRAIYTMSRPLKARVMMVGGLTANVLDFPIPEPPKPKLPEPGDGHRLLEIGEEILPGDEVHWPDDPVKWNKMWLRDGRLFVQETARGYCPYGYYRRKVEYRPLEPDERTQPGDEFCSAADVGEANKEWLPVKTFGVRAGVWGSCYRRKITADPLSEVLKTLKEISTLDSESSKKIQALITQLETK